METTPVARFYRTTALIVEDNGPLTVNLAKFEILCQIRHRPISGKIRWKVHVIPTDYRRNDIAFLYRIAVIWKEGDTLK